MVVPARQRQAQEAERLRQQQQAAAARASGASGSSRRPRRRRTGPAPSPRSGSTKRARRSAIIFTSRLSSLYQILLMVSFIPFLVYFMLSWRDHINRSFLQFFHGEDRLVAARSLQGIAEMVRAFVVGNFLLGLLLACMSSIAFWVMHFRTRCWSGPSAVL